MTDLPDRYSERQLREILARAVRIQTAEYTQQDLEDVAAAMGIEPAALMRAIQDVSAADAPLARPRGRSPRLLGPTVLGSALGLLSPLPCPSRASRTANAADRYVIDPEGARP